MELSPAAPRVRLLVCREGSTVTGTDPAPEHRHCHTRPSGPSLHATKLRPASAHPPARSARPRRPTLSHRIYRQNQHETVTPSNARILLCYFPQPAPAHQNNKTSRSETTEQSPHLASAIPQRPRPPYPPVKPFRPFPFRVACRNPNVTLNAFHPPEMRTSSPLRRPAARLESWVILTFV